jgi:SAM-dependent methyltransferase
VDVEKLKEQSRRMWGRGEYAPLAVLLEPVAQEVVDACAVSAGQEVLDVAAGTGNVALLAAAEGASVVASDLTPELLEQGRARAAEQGLELEWVEADAEALPFEDSRFDCVTSLFDAPFPPRPEVVAAELFRVARPGGVVGMANWTPRSFQARVFEAWAKYIPRPEGTVAPSLWGDEAILRERFEGHASRVEAETRTVRWELESPEAIQTLFANTPSGVTQRETLEPNRYDALQRDFLALVEEWGAADDGRVAIDCEYLLVVAHRRG